jgi:hypothetical protein
MQRRGLLTVREMLVPVPGEVGQRVLAVLVRGEEARVRRARAHHHRRHAADGPAHKHTHYRYTHTTPLFQIITSRDINWSNFQHAS